MVCDLPGLTHRITTPKGKRNITQTLKSLYHHKHIYNNFQARLQKVGYVVRDEHILKPKRGRPRCAPPPVNWDPMKAKRRSMMALPPSSDRKRYRKKVLDDQRYVKNMVFPGAPRRARAQEDELDALPDNGTGLPPASYSWLSKGLESWCSRGSWGISCHDSWELY